MPPNERELPMLAALAACIAWVEELLALLSGPLLTGGLAIALIDLLTDGRLLTTQPELLYAWAVSQAAGLDAQLVGSAAKLARAARARRVWAAVGYAALIVALGYVAYLASDIFAVQQADGISTAAALARLGLDGSTWIVQRSALSVALVVLSGLLRYVRPAESSVEDEAAKLERELALEPLRQQVRQVKAKGAVSLAGALIGRGGDTSDTSDTSTSAALSPVPSDGRFMTRQDALQPPQLATMATDMLLTAETLSAPLQRVPDATFDIDFATLPPAPDDDPDPEPTPPAPRGRSVRTASQAQPAILRLTPDQPRRRRAAQGRGQARGKRANGRPMRTGSVEGKVRGVWRAGMSVSQLEREAGISRSAAGKYRRLLMAEAAQGDVAAR